MLVKSIENSITVLKLLIEPVEIMVHVNIVKAIELLKIEKD